MKKELLATLSTGDKVKNNKTGENLIVGVYSMKEIGMVSVYDIQPVEDWEFTRSRFIITYDERRVIEEYHRKIKEQQEKQR